MMQKDEISKIKILFVTGTRADYGKLEPLARGAANAGFQISFFITGMHLMKKYGNTTNEVKKFENAAFFEYVNQRSGDPLDFVLSKTVLGFSDFVSEHRPDLVVIHGDRVEALAASLVCALNYIPTAHIEGGETSGSIDESIRHCNTKLCYSHFVSSTDAGARVAALGEDPSRIYVVGSPELDIHSSIKNLALKDVKLHYGIEFPEYGILVFHPVASEVDTITQQCRSLFSTLIESTKSFVVICPNNDPGNEKIFAELAKLPSNKFRLIPSMRFSFFSVLMKNSKIIIGNSSAGVREAPFMGIPSIDIGSRQTGRGGTKSILSCSAYDRTQILEFINNNWGKIYQRSEKYGNGNATANFLEIICKKEFWRFERQKKFHSQSSGA